MKSKGKTTGGMTGAEILRRILRGMLYAMPLALYFSYHPVIALGVGESMNFELSLAMIWLVLYDLTAVVAMCSFHKWKEAGRKFWKWMTLPVFVTLSLIWTENLVRGVLTVGVMWAIVLAVVSFVVLKDEIVSAGFWRKFWKWFFGATLVACGWCFLQCILDIAGVGREYTLMCLGCTYRSFGFQHPNGFAIEPQFMGNLLLAPTVIAAYAIINKKQNNKYLLFCFFVVVATLFLTLSRGAIYSFIVAMVFLTGFLIARRKKMVKQVAAVWGAIVLSFLFTLNLQGIFTWLGPTNDTYMDGVSRVVSQLSLGTIEIGKNMGNAEESQAVETNGGAVENYVEKSETEAVFDGYVPESTEVRVKLTNDAIAVWKKDLKTMILGVGIGGAGQALYNNGLTDSPKEIVQNEYASLLLETGLVGATLAVCLVIGVAIIMWQKMEKGGERYVMVLILMVAYGVSLCFFSGFANALHIYLLPTMLLALLTNEC